MQGGSSRFAGFSSKAQQAQTAEEEATAEQLPPDEAMLSPSKRPRISEPSLHVCTAHIYCFELPCGLCGPHPDVSKPCPQQHAAEVPQVAEKRWWFPCSFKCTDLPWLVMQGPGESMESEVTLAKGVAVLESSEPSEVCTSLYSVPGQWRLIMCSAAYSMHLRLHM